MAKHTVVLQVRCTYEINARSYTKAVIKALDQFFEDGVYDFGGYDDDLKDVCVDEVRPFAKGEKTALVTAPVVTKPVIITDVNSPLYTANKLNPNA